MVAVTPGSLSKGGSMHQKQPPAKIATAWPGGMAGGDAARAVAAKASVAAKRVKRFIRFSVGKVPA
jgi:hypothetical protein